MRGFTLAELMGVIVILGILAVVITTTIDKNITNSRYETCKSQEENLIQAAQMYVTDNPDVLPRLNGGQHAEKSVPISDLIAGNYIESDMENPMTEKPYSNNVKVIVKTTNGKKFTYEVSAPNDEKCQK